MRTLLEALLALAAAALWPVAALAAEALAMVTDVQGRVLLAPGRAPRITIDACASRAGFSFTSR